MKKTLIAIAALAATGAFAQSTVTIDGVVDAGYVSYNYKGNGVTGVDRNLTSTSGLNFRVATDLGGGLKAAWRSETNFVTTSNGANQGTVGNVATLGTNNGTASTFMNGEQVLSLAGGFGTVKLGAVNNAALFAHLTSQPFGTAIGSGFGATSGSFATANVRLDNSLQYVSPKFAGGFSIGMLTRKQQAVNGTNTNFNATLGAQAQSQALDWNLDYNAGPINASLVRSTNDASNNAVAAGAVSAIPATAGKGVYTALVGNYAFANGATVYGGYQLNKVAPFAAANTTDRQTLTLGVKYVTGVNTFMGSYQRASNNLQTQLPGASNLIGLGYEYALSKTTALTARYERIGDAANLVAITPFAANPATASDRTRMGVGLRMAF